MKKFSLMLLTGLLFTCIFIVHGSADTVHYVTSVTPIHHGTNGWYYDGRNWIYLKNNHRLTGKHTFNHINYYFTNDGIQILPYQINYQYELSNRQGTNKKARHRFIILHDVGTPGSAKSQAQYMKEHIDKREAYSNFIVGDYGQVYQMKPAGTIAWGAGVVANENSPAQIELARTHNPIKFFQDYWTYIKLARDMSGKYDIPLTLDKGNRNTPGIKSHIWVTNHIWGTHKDPYEYLIRFGVLRNVVAFNLRYGI